MKNSSKLLVLSLVLFLGACAVTETPDEHSLSDMDKRFIAQAKGNYSLEGVAVELREDGYIYVGSTTTVKYYLEKALNKSEAYYFIDKYSAKESLREKQFLGVKVSVKNTIKKLVLYKKNGTDYWDSLNSMQNVFSAENKVIDLDPPDPPDPTEDPFIEGAKDITVFYDKTIVVNSTGNVSENGNTLYTFVESRNATEAVYQIVGQAGYIGMEIFENNTKLRMYQNGKTDPWTDKVSVTFTAVHLVKDLDGDGTVDPPNPTERQFINKLKNLEGSLYGSYSSTDNIPNQKRISINQEGTITYTANVSYPNNIYYLEEAYSSTKALYRQKMDYSSQPVKQTNDYYQVFEIIDNEVWAYYSTNTIYSLDMLNTIDYDDVNDQAEYDRLYQLAYSSSRHIDYRSLLPSSRMFFKKNDNLSTSLSEKTKFFNDLPSPLTWEYIIIDVSGGEGNWRWQTNTITATVVGDKISYRRYRSSTDYDDWELEYQGMNGDNEAIFEQKLVHGDTKTPVLFSAIKIQRNEIYYGFRHEQNGSEIILNLKSRNLYKGLL